MAEATGLLVKVRGDGAGFAAATRSMRLGAADIEPILTVPPAAGPGLGAGADRGATWLKLGAKAARSENPWDNAHDLIGRGGDGGRLGDRGHGGGIGQGAGGSLAESIS